MDWRDYEHFIYNHFRNLYPEAKIDKDVKIVGHISKTKRQIDILVDISEVGVNLKLAIECKYFNKKIDVKTIDSFVGFLDDIKANKGIIITSKGFSSAASERAKNDTRDVEVKIIEFSELEYFQGFGGAIVHYGPFGAIFPCPIGWVIDGRSEPQMLAKLYPYGLSLEKAFILREVMYVNIATTNEYDSIDSLLTYQEKYTRDKFENVEINISNFVQHRTFKDKYKCVLRLMNIPSYNALEYTAFIEFEKFIFYVVLLTPEKNKKLYLLKLESIIKNVLPMNVIK